MAALWRMHRFLVNEPVGLRGVCVCGGGGA